MMTNRPSFTWRHGRAAVVHLQRCIGRIVMAGLVTIATPSLAATYYFADCARGAVATCVPGNNIHAGTNPSLPKRDMTGISIRAGDVYRFARGGAWANVQLRIYAPGSSRATPTVFEDYAPTWGAGAPRPRLQGASGKSVIWFLDGVTAVHDEGYVLRNLELRGPGDGTGKGLVLSNDVDHVTADGLLIRGFAIGVHVIRATNLASGSDGISAYFTLRGSTVSDNAVQGFLGGGYNLLLENNLFDNNGFAEAVRNHNVYLSEVSDRAIVRGNTLTNSAVIDGACQGTSLVAHGWHPRLTIENNLVMETNAAGGCWGIILDSNTTTSDTPQNFTGLVVRNNRVSLRGEATTGIGCSSCPGAVIENNHVVRTGGIGAFSAIRWPTSSVFQAARGDVPNGAVTVRNNSIYIDVPSRSHAAIRAPAVGSVGDMVVSNLVTFGPSTPIEARCFDTGGRAASRFKAFDHNFCGRAGGLATWSAMYPTLAAARSAGFDLNGLVGDPRLESSPTALTGWILRPRSDSAAVSNGHRSYSAPTDYTGKLRDDRPDIGSIELRSTIRRPAPPTQVSIK
jgi:hypothetical protein